MSTVGTTEAPLRVFLFGGKQQVGPRLTPADFVMYVGGHFR